MQTYRERASSILLSERWFSGGHLAWTLTALAMSLLALAFLLVLIGWTRPLPASSSFQWPGQLIWIIGAAGAPILGGLIASHHPTNRYGWVWCGLGVSLAFFLAVQTYVAYAVATSGTLPLQNMAVVVGALAWLVLVGHIPFLLLLFPDGTLPSPGWRFVAWAVVAACAVSATFVSFVPGESGIAPAPNPLALNGQSGEIARGIVITGVFVILGATVLAAISLIYRFRKTKSVERQQIKWVTYAGVMLGFSAIFTGFLGWELPGVWDAAVAAATLGAVYLAIYIAILKHGLYDIDLLINRTLVYGVLTAVIIGTYVFMVGYVGALFHTDESLLISLVTTGVIAVLFQPLREQVQQGVNRLLYGQRDDPYEAVTSLGKRLEATMAQGDMLPEVVRSIREALKLSYVAVATRQGSAFSVAAEIGTPDGVPLYLPLNYGSKQVGELRLASRGPNESFTVSERRLLDDMARQVGVAVRAAEVTVELQRSRERLVVAQEEERRRIQRDLHDGLGPVLASMRIRLEGCLDLAQAEGSPVSGDLERLHELLGQASADIRRLVHDLRPPALDQLGLVPTLRQHVERFSRETGIATEFEAPDMLATPAAVEVAVFRIVHEALVNVDKHARASQAIVRLCQRGSWLSLDICDDGIGLPEDKTMTLGAGLVSMRERAELLGGTARFMAGAGGGTQVSVQLPSRSEY